MTAWRPLEDELAAWHDCNRTPTLWWRDDDACRDSAALRRLLQIADAFETPAILATIPALLERSLRAILEGRDAITVVQHGYAHLNHAPPGARNWELGAHRPIGQTIAELVKGRTILEERFDRQFIAALVPPWNRIDDAVISELPKVGFIGLSTFAPRTTRAPVRGLLQANTHVDLIAWRRDRSFIGPAKAIERLVEHLRARRRAEVDSSEPTGILTHHLDFSDGAWDFLAELIPRSRALGAAWLGAAAVFETGALELGSYGTAPTSVRSA